MNCFKGKLDSSRLSNSKTGNRYTVERFRYTCCFGWCPIIKKTIVLETWQLLIVELIPQIDDGI